MEDIIIGQVSHLLHLDVHSGVVEGRIVDFDLPVEDEDFIQCEQP